MPQTRLDAWIKALGWEVLVNRKGTTWRKLDPQQQAAVKHAASARTLMLAQASVIRRPVVEWADGSLTVGFEADDWKKTRLSSVFTSSDRPPAARCPARPRRRPATWAR